MNKKEEQEARRKLKILAHVKETGNVSRTCRYRGISRDTFYRWKKDYAAEGEKGLINSKPCPENPTIRVAQGLSKKRSSGYAKTTILVALKSAGISNVITT